MRRTKTITYKDAYGNEYEVNNVPASMVEWRIKHIQETNDGKATIISVIDD